jgi:tetratricopeptide (TPR) repeat protein
MRKLSIYSFITAFLLISVFLPTASQAQTAARTASDTVMVLPFENTSNLSSYNWVGESFAEALTDLFARLEQRNAGMRVVPNAERKIIQQKLRLPLTTLPSLATSIKLAQQSRATLLVLGKYSVTPQQGEVAASLRVTARVVRVQDGTFLGEVLRDGRTVMREVDLADAVSKLQTLQGQVAHQILYQREGNSLSLSQNEVVELAKTVPPRSFEAFVKGMLTAETDELRANYFKNALRLYAEERGGEVYAQAALELGNFYLRQNNFQTAEEFFSKVPRTSDSYAEAGFYAGLMQWNLNNRDAALATFRQLADSTRLTAAYNNAGAAALELSQKSKAEGKSEMLEEGLKYLEEAAKSSPEDDVIRFNYGYALFEARRYKDAANTLREVVKDAPSDGQAYFLLAKAQERNSETTAATETDNQARRYLATYAKAQTEWQKSGTTGDIPFRLFKNFNRLERKQPDSNSGVANSDNELQNKISKARELYTAGRDDEALSELRQILIKDSMNADSYLLIGKILQRRGDLEAAVSNLKTAIFWKNDLIEGHILLGRIFLEKSDFIQATAYAKNALQIDPNNQDAIALMRQIERRTK